MNTGIAMALYWLTLLYASILLIILLTAVFCVARTAYRITATDLIRDEWERTIYRIRRGVWHMQSLRFRFHSPSHPGGDISNQLNRQKQGQVQKRTDTRRATDRWSPWLVNDAVED